MFLWKLLCLWLATDLFVSVYANDLERYRLALKSDAIADGEECKDVFIERPNEVAMRTAIQNWNSPIGFFARLDKEELAIIASQGRHNINPVALASVFVGHGEYEKANYIWSHLKEDGELAAEIGNRYATRKDWLSGLPPFIVLRFRAGIPYLVMIPAVVFPEAARKLQFFIPTLSEVILVGTTQSAAQLETLRMRNSRIVRAPFYNSISVRWEFW